ncbi:hypothetical protein [Janthinobacterium sp. PAMC25594]|uniref:hypothetical protein n=1 Tax=unclassified Janthinobacterium TaxID=2610881 RepID=UPI001C6294BF|nr:hypothetical protein [Janthinobacterium sp. PAMC25594]QYG09020.1 hypothetical protein KY494_09910 [Janthinobacterium sp. PAMC25594]
MVDKVEFKRDVNSAVMGNMNEAPRLSNVVTLHVGDKEKEIELITSYQRSNIKSLVDRLAALVGDEEIKIYRGLITDYGLQKFKELPRSKYQEVKAILEGRIDEATTPLPLPLAPPSVAEPNPVTIHHSHTALPCLACAEKSLSFSRLQRTARFQLAALITCLIACGWLLYKEQPPFADHDASTAKEEKCYIAGKAYSIGHIERSRGRGMECVGPAGELPSMWLPENR